MKDTQVEAPKKHHEGSDNIVVRGGLFGCRSLVFLGDSLVNCRVQLPLSLHFTSATVYFLFFSFFLLLFFLKHTHTHIHSSTPSHSHLPLSPVGLFLGLPPTLSVILRSRRGNFFLPSLLFSNHFLQETTLHHHIHHCLGALSIVPGLISSP